MWKWFWWILEKWFLLEWYYGNVVYGFGVYGWKYGYYCGLYVYVYCGGVWEFDCVYYVV